MTSNGRRDRDSGQGQLFSIWLCPFHIPAPGRKTKPGEPVFIFRKERPPPRGADSSAVEACSRRRWPLVSSTGSRQGLGAARPPQSGAQTPGKRAGARKEGASWGVCVTHTQACS